MRQPKLNRIKATGTTVGDVHFPKVKTLLPLNGSNGGTSATDESNSNATVTFQGSSTTSTAQSKFGGSSLYVPNSDPAGIYFGGAGTTIQLTGDFTIEWWVYRIQTTLSANMVLGPMWGVESVSNPNSASNRYALIIGYISSGQTNPQMWCSTNGSSWNLINGAYLGTAAAGTVNQWVHMALTRSGTTWNYYADGTRTYTANHGSDALPAAGSYVTLGKSYTDTNSYEAYYNDLRITQGLARYTGASFTVSTTAHLTSAGDVNKHIVVNSDADGVAIGTGGISQARIAKSWINFNGGGTIAIRDSYNVSSITDNGTGDYTITFSTAMGSVDYSVSGTMGNSSAVSTWWARSFVPKTYATGSLRVVANDSDGVAEDHEYVNCLIFGN